MNEIVSSSSVGAMDSELPRVIVILLRGVLYREDDLKLWSKLLMLRAQIAHYMSALGLGLHIDETEGHAFLRNTSPEAGEEATIPRLISRRPLTFYDSLLLALLRKKLAEFDASGTDSRLVLKRDQIQELVALFLPEHTDEMKLRGRIEPSVQRLQEMGFLRKLKTTGADESFEVRRIIKAFVDAQWLNGLNDGLASYRAHSLESQPN